MIPYQYALLCYIPIAALFMLDRNTARGFSLAYLFALLLLPSTANPVSDSNLGLIDLPVIPDLHKGNVPSIGILLGTILFKPERFDRFRLSPLDFVLFVLMQFVFLTSYVNGFGWYDGVAQVLKWLLNFVLIVFLARIHIGTPAGLRMFMLCMIFASIGCLPFALWEFRFSPQIHTTVYGYFQHVFQQHMRGGYFRPILFFSHGLELARFFAASTFLAAFPVRRDLAGIFGPAGNFVFLLPLMGLAVSMSLGPYMYVPILIVGWYLVQRYRWAYFALPVLAFSWIIAFFFDIEIGFNGVHRFFGFSAERADSLEYRLVALREYKSTILAAPFFGWGGFNSAHTNRATDSIALINFLTYGFFGGVTYFSWWFGVLTIAHRVKDAAYGTFVGARARAVALICALALAVSVIDSALDTYLLIMVSSLISIDLWLASNPQIPTLVGYEGRHFAAPPALHTVR